MPEPNQQQQQKPPEDPELSKGMQDSFDLLALAIGQSSRDPQVLQSVLQGIEQRRQEALAVEQAELARAAEMQKLERAAELEKQTAAEAETRRQEFETKQREAGEAHDVKMLGKRLEGEQQIRSQEAADRERREKSEAAERRLQQLPAESSAFFLGLLRTNQVPRESSQFVIAQAQGLMQKAAREGLTVDEQKRLDQLQAMIRGQEGLQIDVETALALTEAFEEQQVAQLPPEFQDRAIQALEDKRAALADAGFAAVAAGESFEELPTQVKVDMTKTSAQELISAITEGRDLDPTLAQFFRRLWDDPRLTDDTREDIVGTVIETIVDQLPGDDPPEFVKSGIIAVLADNVYEGDVQQFRDFIGFLGPIPEKSMFKPNAIFKTKEQAGQFNLQTGTTPQLLQKLIRTQDVKGQ